MQFLKTLFWVLVAVGLVLFGSVNWHPVTVTLWGGLEADVKLPILVLGVFLLGFIPMFLFHRARLWSLRRRLESYDRQAAVVSAPAQQAPATAPSAEPEAGSLNPIDKTAPSA